MSSCDGGRRAIQTSPKRLRSKHFINWKRSGETVEWQQLADDDSGESEVKVKMKSYSQKNKVLKYMIIALCMTMCFEF